MKTRDLEEGEGLEEGEELPERVRALILFDELDLEGLTILGDTNDSILAWRSPLADPKVPANLLNEALGLWTEMEKPAGPVCPDDEEEEEDVRDSISWTAFTEGHSKTESTS